MLLLLGSFSSATPFGKALDEPPQPHQQQGLSRLPQLLVGCRFNMPEGAFFSHAN